MENTLTSLSCSIRLSRTRKLVHNHLLHFESDFSSVMPLPEPVQCRIFEILGVYRQKEVQATIELRDQITPFLIEIAETVASNPSEYADRPGYFAHIYAMILPGHFREPRSHEAIVELAGLPDGLAEKMSHLMNLDGLGVIVTAPGQSADFVSRFFSPKAGVLDGKSGSRVPNRIDAGQRV